MPLCSMADTMHQRVKSCRPKPDTAQARAGRVPITGTRPKKTAGVLLLFGPIRFLASQTAQQPKAFALAAVENRLRRGNSAAVLAPVPKRGTVLALRTVAHEAVRPLERWKAAR